MPHASRFPANWGRAFDVMALALLAGVAYVARRGSLPDDGLWFDDSWVAAGAMLGHPSELLTVGSGHPGFTAILMGVDRLGGGDLTHLGVPSLVFGVLAPAALYLGLRSFGYARAISAIVGAVLVIAPIHILYSGRVKGYTLDTLTVLLIAVVIPCLARRTWSWLVGTAWVIAAIGLGTFSAYTLLATVGAGVVLVLHPSRDRTVRMLAVAAQSVCWRRRITWSVSPLCTSTRGSTTSEAGRRHRGLPRRSDGGPLTPIGCSSWSVAR